MKTFSLALIWATAAMLGSVTLAETDKDAVTLNQMAGYRQWTRVNPEPVEVSIPVTRTAGAISIDPAVLS
jgi:hypothetical protein